MFTYMNTCKAHLIFGTFIIDSGILGIEKKMEREGGGDSVIEKTRNFPLP